MFAVASALTAAGPACVIPPNLEPDDGDAGPSSPPVIVEAGPAPDFSFPGPIQFHRPDPRELSLILRDVDLDDVLYVRLFVDYGRPPLLVPTPPYVECQAAPTGLATRVAVCPVAPLCSPVQATDADDHFLEAMVADRPFLFGDDPLQPTYRALADVGRASWSLRSWIMRCDTL